MNSNDLPKAYEAAAVESEIFKDWEKSGAFDPEGLEKLAPRYKDAEPYCIVLPPPNRTGTLHLGHAVMLAIEDLLIRFHRMQGKKTYWVPGTDHAAIATQVKVEGLLREQGMKDPRHELGREKFLEKVREFAQKSRDTIVNQCKGLGASMDWTREKYTLDEERSKAVFTVFKMMFEDGLIERGKRIVNWDPVMQSNVSDDEIEWKEERAPFYTFQYGPFEISTARPETKFGDKYVVMHPDDKRYAKYKHGDTFTCEWISGPVTATVIKDAAIDPEFGTGVMTITPWHDMVDFEIAERHGLDMEQIIDLHGRLMPIAGEFQGMPIDEARPKIVEKLKAKGLLTKTDENYLHNVAVNYRGGAKIEPQIQRQWFIRVNKPFKLRQNTLGKWKMGETATLKDLMREAVASKQTRIVPERFDKIYFHWIDNLRDWCISRQIWFGHRIPVWYKNVGAGSPRPVAETAPLQEGEFIVSDVSPGPDYEQDPDTLDTWFSSGLWTFSTLGWPDNATVGADGNLVKKGELAEFHPTSVLETGYDILFFWIARMILMSTYALGEVPFKDAYLHGLVRDEQGRKMSKSLGNVIDPLVMIQKYGTDAVRLALTLGATPGQDQKLSEEKIQGFRNFTNKLWNISRFILLQIGNDVGAGLPRPGAEIAVQPQDTNTATLADQWILSRLAEVTASVTKKIQAYEFSSAGEELRDFTWGDLADWYLEIAKIQSKDVGAQFIAPILTHILKTILALWHPFMPFVTEHIWKTAGFEGSLIVAPWPDAKHEVPSTKYDVSCFEALRDLITVARRLRAENGVEPQKQVEIVIQGAKEIQDQTTIIATLVRASSVQFVEAIPEGWVSSPAQKGMVGLNVAGAIDVAKEKTKLEKELADAEKYVASLESKLSNAEFTSKAPEKVVEDMKAKKEEAEAKAAALKQRLEKI